MEKFLYVFTDEDRDFLLSHGMSMLKEDRKNHLYVFANQDDLKFDLSDIELAKSNTLSF